MMTTETTDTQDIIPTTADEQPQYTLETLPKLSVQQTLMLDYILQGYTYTSAYRMAGYTSVDQAHSASWQLANRNPLKAHISYFTEQMAKRCTAEYKVAFLNRIAEQCTKEENIIKNSDSAIKAIDLMAKIQGHHAPTNVQVASVTGSIDDIRRAKAEYIKDK